MDAEILFFMTAKDQEHFLVFATDFCDSVTEQVESNALSLDLSNCHLLFTPTEVDQNTLFTGKLEIRLSSLSAQVDLADRERKKIVFRKLRNYIKKYYWSRLAYINKRDKLTPSRNHWLGPDAKSWKESDMKNHHLKLSRTSWMEFELGY